MKQLNILDLHRSINEKKHKKAESYDRLLDICHKKIETHAGNQQLRCVLEVPSFVFGFPIFDYNKGIEYVYNSLQKNGFLVKYYFPKYLYISWDFEEINTSKTSKKKVSQLTHSSLQNPVSNANGNTLSYNKKDSKTRKNVGLSYKPSGKLQLDLD